MKNVRDDRLAHRGRHQFFWTLMRAALAPVSRLAYGYTWETFRGTDENYVVLLNHATNFDSLLVSLSFPRQMYFVASEHFFRNPLRAWFLRWSSDPILKVKGKTGISTTYEMLRVLKAGGNVCMYPEGNRRFDGTLMPIAPATAGFVKKCGAALVTYRLEGTYLAAPRWSRSIRRGRIHGTPVNVYSAAQLAQMRVEEIDRAIRADIREDAYERQKKLMIPFRGKRLAEGLENLLWFCPACGAMDSFTASGDAVTCGVCGLRVTHDAYAMLHGARFETVSDWTKWQIDELFRRFDSGELDALTDRDVSLVVVDQRGERQLARGTVRFDRSGLRLGEFFMPLSDITGCEALGMNILIFVSKGVHYEIKRRGLIAYKYLNAWRYCAGRTLRRAGSEVK